MLQKNILNLIKQNPNTSKLLIPNNFYNHNGNINFNTNLSEHQDTNNSSNDISQFMFNDTIFDKIDEQNQNNFINDFKILINSYEKNQLNTLKIRKYLKLKHKSNFNKYFFTTEDNYKEIKKYLMLQDFLSPLHNHQNKTKNFFYISMFSLFSLFNDKYKHNLILNKKYIAGNIFFILNSDISHEDVNVIFLFLLENLEINSNSNSSDVQNIISQIKINLDIHINNNNAFYYSIFDHKIFIGNIGNPIPNIHPHLNLMLKKGVISFLQHPFFKDFLNDKVSNDFFKINSDNHYNTKFKYFATNFENEAISLPTAIFKNKESALKTVSIISELIYKHYFDINQFFSQIVTETHQTLLSSPDIILQYSNELKDYLNNLINIEIEKKQLNY